MAKLISYEVQMLQGWRETLMAELKRLGEIEGAGYSDGSTVWRVIVSTRRFKNTEQLNDYLRAVLRHDGWLKVEEYKWSEEEEEVTW